MPDITELAAGRIGSTEIAAAVAAAGSVVGDAGVLLSGYKHYPTSGADATKGVIIAAADMVVGNTFWVGNGTAGVLKIYPPTGCNINALAANAAISTTSGRGLLFQVISALTLQAIG